MSAERFRLTLAARAVALTLMMFTMDATMGFNVASNASSDGAR